jgi:hypothetical protein
MNSRVMKQMVSIKWVFAFILVALGFACTQEEGPGGNSHIKGCLIEKVYNQDFSLLLEERPAKDWDVFLLFGNQKSVGEDVKTSFSGDFNFQYLWPGTYKVYYFSQDSSDFGIEKEVVSEIQLDKNQTRMLDTLYCFSTLDWNDGTAVVKGKVIEKNYKNSSSYPNLQTKYIVPAKDKEVFLLYGTETVPVERVRTSYDGTFEFKNLIKGTYKVFVLSEDVTEETDQIPIFKEALVTENGQVIDLGIFNTEKL